MRFAEMNERPGGAWDRRRSSACSGSTGSVHSISTTSARPATPSGSDWAKTTRGWGWKPSVERKGRAARRSIRSKARIRS
jgi:hypothetical protein